MLEAPGDATKQSQPRVKTSFLSSRENEFKSETNVKKSREFIKVKLHT